MSIAKSVPVEAGWSALLHDLGLRPVDVLRRAGLPEDLFTRPDALLDVAGYFRFWSAIETAVDDPLFPMRLIDAVSPEVFSPPLFAALCSPDLASALQRLAQHKRLVAPMALDLSEGVKGRLTARPRWLEAHLDPPPSLMLSEIAFLLRLGRLGTRRGIRAVRVSLPQSPQRLDAVEAYFGCALSLGESASISFSAADAELPFLTSSDAMWRVFEPELRRRLMDLDRSASLSDRVKALLLEALPSGRAGMDEVASRLALSRRTLQRRLGEEGVTFQGLVTHVRTELARHYLSRTRLPLAEISFLLGFEDANSFHRAFHEWTGKSPDRWRQSCLAKG